MEELIVPARILNKYDRLVKTRERIRRTEADLTKWLQSKGFPMEDPIFIAFVTERIRSGEFANSQEFVHALNDWRQQNRVSRK